MKYNALFLVLPLLLSSCGREEIATYQVPKSSPAPAVSAPVAAPEPTTGVGFSSTLPEGWTEVPGAGMRKVSYTISGTSIDFYLISLAMGDVPSNVNRWRGQVGLAPVSAEAIAAEQVSFPVGGHPANYFEIYNDGNGDGIVAAIVDLAPQYWYFKAKGSVAELKAHQADVRAFLASITFDGHNH